MNILTIQQSIKLSEKLRREGKSIVLAGGCFDILHAGHIAFLKAAKKQGDSLFVLLESDDAVRKRKGKERPINTLKDRSVILSALRFVDYVIPLPKSLTHQQYDSLTNKLKPAIIATTKGNRNRYHMERQANQFGIQLVDVIERIPNKSTSELLRQLFQKNI